MGCHGDGFAVRREGEPFIPAVRICALQLDLAEFLAGGGVADAQTEVLPGYDRPPVGGDGGGFNRSSFLASKGIERAARNEVEDTRGPQHMVAVDGNGDLAIDGDGQG